MKLKGNLKKLIYVNYLTKFVSKHKGGDKILAACGVDATDYFTGKHPTIGRVHSELAVKLLSSMKIGTLQK